jgi:hypothetical protein
LLVACALCAWCAIARAEEPRISWLTPPDEVVDRDAGEGASQLPPLLPPEPQSQPSLAEPAVAPGPEEIPAPTAAAREAEIDAILRRLEALEKSAGQSEDAAQEKAAEQAAAKEPAEEWIDLSAEKWNVKLGGHVQMDQIVWPDHSPQIPAFNYFEFRRLRLLADGVGYGV